MNPKELDFREMEETVGGILIHPQEDPDSNEKDAAPGGTAEAVP